MKKNLLFIFLFVSICISAQNYNAYVPGRTAFFLLHDYSTQYHVQSIRPDTSFTLGNFTCYTDYRRDIANFLSMGCLYISDTGWAGKNIFQLSNGKTCFVSSAGDSIWFFPSAANGQDGFIVPFQNGDTLHGNIISVAQQNIIGVPDSVKTMQLQLRDAAGNPIASLFNGKYIQSAKDHGMILGYNWRDFPNDTNAYRLAGMTNPQEGIRIVTAADIFNFNIGDQFDFLIASNTDATQFPNLDQWYTRVVIAKNISANNDTITYTFNENYCRKMGNVIQGQHMNQAVNVTYILSQLDSLNYFPDQPIELVNPPDTAAGFFEWKYPDFPYNNSLYNGRMQKEFADRAWGWGYNSADHCFDFTVYPDMCDGIDMTFADGVGQVAGHDGSATCFLDYYLLYFSKGTETWGTPNDWSVILGEKEINFIHAKAWPDPAIDILNIDFGFPVNAAISYQITDLSGRLLNEGIFSANGNVIQVPVNELPAGLYIFKGVINGQQIVLKFAH
ncbi:MAG: T9SS type A sorting domain-containing protein [Bacteroidetes bacterium]|nr:T9SS type A sorting domain-containing protein [Bacteroidota bacterium]